MLVALVTGSLLPECTAAADQPLAAALQARGVEVVRPRWDDADAPWQRLDAAVIRTTWDYPPRRDDFLRWAEATAAHCPVWNPPDVVRWNTHKSYLLELEERGAPVVPTAWLARGDRIDLADLLTARGWHDAIVKPAVGASARGLVRVGDDDLAAGQRHLDGLLVTGDAMVQPYLDAVERQGELSVVVIDGRVSHAVRKRPSIGDFRVQQQYGGVAEPVDLDPDTVALAAWVVEATGTDLLYARVDLVEDAAGVPQVVEVEATEPDLYLAAVPEAADTVADAILGRLGA